MRSFVRLLSALVLLLARAEASVAACSDPAAAAAVRGQCDCASAANHGAYVSCVAHATNAAVKAGTLPDDCASTVMNCASNSTCGKPGFVTCCETDARGTTTCNVVNGPGACTAPKGGSACVGTQPSCCDACANGECAGGGTTTSTVASTTSTVATTTSTVGSTSTTLATTTSTVGSTSTTLATTTSTVGSTSTTVATTTSTVGSTSTTLATTTSTVGSTSTTLATTTTTVATTTTTIATTTTTVATTTTTIATTTTTTTSSTTTTVGTCAPIVPSAAIANTYRLNGTTGEKRCVTTSAANRFGTCTTDADCGNTAGGCLQLPWVTADGQVMPFPTGVQTNFTVTPGTFPTCEHSACVPCGNPHASCAGIPGCEVAGNPNGCVPRGTQGCCDQPGFIVPTFFVNILGGLCSRVDQIDCGVGVVNTSNPQTGDNDVFKMADTSDPGPDCIYGTADDPAHKACTATGEGNDLNGKIVRTLGNNSPDANGIQFRLNTPELSTTWTDGQSPPGTCANGSTYDDGELLVSQLVLKAEPTSAGASGAFVDMNGDGCRRAGSGFIAPTNPDTDGPITVPGGAAGPLRPQSYDGTVGPVTGAVSEVFSGPNSPIRDIGFVAITPNMPAVVVPAVACTCTPVAGCPE